MKPEGHRCASSTQGSFSREIWSAKGVVESERSSPSFGYRLREPESAGLTLAPAFAVRISEICTVYCK